MANFLTNKKKQRDASEEFARKYPHPHISMLQRPDYSRRGFFKLAAAGVTGSYLMPRLSAATGQVVSNGSKTLNTAKNVIFVHLTGAMSHVDTLDLKVTNGVTPSTMNPTTVNGIDWPMGLMPKLGARLSDIGLVRSMSSWALVHSLAQSWVQIARNPVAALGDIAPNVGSVVALEKEKERRASQIFPGFIALNAGNAEGQGYFKATYAPFQVTPRVAASGVANTTNALGQTVFGSMYTRLQQYDSAMRGQAPYGSSLQDMDAMYQQARGLMYSPTVDAAFTVSAADSLRYGNGTTATGFGNACVLAKQILSSDQGTRFIQINIGSWDHHQNIYAANNLPAMSAQLDNGLGALIDDLRSLGRLQDTLIVVQGEFGRTPVFTAAAGRDHYLIQSAMFIGGGVKGGKAIGATNPVGTQAGGSTVTDFGWAGSGTTGPRMVRPEDIESTLYSALGIDWTTVRYDDPFGRGFEYIPFAKVGTYGPINELFT